jgi:hypothetical protein
MAALAAVALCARAATRHPGRGSAFWWLLGTGCLFWAFGEATWAAYDLSGPAEVPFPGLPDVGYLTGVVFVCAALLAHPAGHRGAVRRGRATLGSLSVATAVFFLSWSLVLGPLWLHSQMSTAAGLVTFTYPFTDTVVVVMVGITLRRSVRADRSVLLVVMTALVLMAGTDFAWAYLTEIRGYTTGNIIDTGWFAAYVALGLAAHRASVPELGRREEASRSSLGLTGAVLPLLPVLLALTVPLVQQQRGERLDATGWWLALVLVVLVIARQVMVLIDTAPLLRQSTSSQGVPS